jgi:hypothetical protein
VRTKSLDFVNAPPHVNVVLSIFRQFMTEKLRQRVSTKFYKDIVLLHHVIGIQLISYMLLSHTTKC